MTNPTPTSERFRRPSTPSFLSLTEDRNPLPTRSGALHSLIRSRSQTSLSSFGTGYRRPHDDEESLLFSRGHWTREDEEDIGRLLQDEPRLTRLLQGPQARSKNLIGKSNPRYRWERYWKYEDQLKNMSKPL